MEKITSIYQKYSGPFNLILLILVAGGGYLWGRNDAPDHVKEVIKEVVTIKEVEKKVTETKEIDSKNKETDKNVHKVKVTVTKPDGTKVEKETTDINKKEKEVEIRYVDKVQIVEKQVEVEKRVEIEKIIDNRNNWAINAKIGLQSKDFAITSTPPYLNPIIFGLEVDRRIVGPFQAGAWIMTNSKFDNVQAGLSLGVTF